MIKNIVILKIQTIYLHENVWIKKKIESYAIQLNFSYILVITIRIIALNYINFPRISHEWYKLIHEFRNNCV